MERLIGRQGAILNPYNTIYEQTFQLTEVQQPDIFELEGNLRILEEKMVTIIDLNKQITNILMDDEQYEEAESQISETDKLVSKFNRLKLKIESIIRKQNDIEVVTTKSVTSSNVRTKLKLPTLEFKKFNGNIIDWLPWWGQFKRIDKDEEMDDADKFEYLLQATVSGSKARQLVESYPSCAQNYPKALESLKSRFGRDDLLVEVYVRQLLQLLLTNLTSKMKLSELYDKLEAQLRALEGLGVTADRYAAILYPLVESCLPQEILKVWQRSDTFNSETTLNFRLSDLRKFLKREVDNEERLSIATSTFNFQKSHKSDLKHSCLLPTTTDLVNQNQTNQASQNKNIKCIFCRKQHSSGIEICPEAQKLSIEQKKNILSERGRCHSCLKYGHLQLRCRTASKLKCKTCSGIHHMLMCPNNSANNSTNVAMNMDTQHTTLAATNQTQNKFFLQTLSVQIISEGKTKTVRAIIDSGSERSYICKLTAEDMQIKTTANEDLIHVLFGGLQTEKVNHKSYDVCLQNITTFEQCHLDLLDQAIICNNIVPISPGPWMNELQEHNIFLSDVNEGPIEILIGVDFASSLYTGRMIQLRCGLTAIETKLGWTIMGKIKVSNPTSSSLLVNTMFCQNNSLSNLWELDILGIKDPAEETSKLNHELSVLQSFKESFTRWEDGRYEVCLPWIDSHPPLINNFDHAKKRLESQVLKVKKDGFYDEYDMVFIEWLKEDIIETIQSNTVPFDSYYLPHRLIIKQDSQTTKFRPVFDASAKNFQHPSLNQCLEKGMNLIELIPGILTRFRTGKIGVTSDIRKAFLQISINPKDRDVLRFLWYNKEGDIKQFCHKRLVFGLTCSPFLLGAVIDQHLEDEINKIKSGNSNYSLFTLNKLKKSFYVDNCVTSLDTPEDLHTFREESTQLLAEAQFDLRLWEHTSQNLQEKEQKFSSVLGLKWNQSRDTLQINFAQFHNDVNLNKVTKRLILSVANKLFDPIGFTYPVLLLPKLFLQQSWKLKCNWDSELPDIIKNPFLDWFKDVSLLQELEIPRYMMVDANLSYENGSLHLFCDASILSYAAVIFIRTEKNGQVLVQLVQAKSRVTPITKTKKISIPRLELMAASIGTRLLKSVVNNMDFTMPIFCWSDSSTALHWIKQDDLWKPFVKNRVKEIRNLTDPNNWYFVPGSMNPADLASRGCSARKLLDLRWWEGPAWLQTPQSEWPKVSPELNEEVIAQEKKRTVTIAMSNTIQYSWYYQNFSSYSKIVSFIGWTLRFISNCRKFKKKNNLISSAEQQHCTTLEKIIQPLSIKEIEKAEHTILKRVQEEAFQSIQNEKLSLLSPIIDQHGLFRIQTKIMQRDDTFDFKYPIILPNKHPVVNKLIMETHVFNCHVGVQGLLCMLREKYWILNSRKAVRSVIAKCVICLRYNSKKFESPTICLPLDRVRDACVFEIIGVDLTGPVYLKNQKHWICIFTCAIYRAVHLELVSSQSTTGFLRALRNFISRRGRPTIIYSDRGSNFVGSDNLFATLDWEEISKYSSAQRIKWKFNPPSAAWWGGWWERLIRLLKQLLRKTLGNTSLDSAEFYSVLCECEAIMNSRPLTYISENPEDLSPLTPSVFIQEIRENGVPDLDQIDCAKLNKRAKYKQTVMEHFRKRFRQEYLGQLVMKRKKNVSREIKTGDIVLIEHENPKRLNWPLAVVKELIMGKDGISRVVKLKTANGELTRPIQRLYPLEIQADEPDRKVLCVSLTKMTHVTKTNFENETHKKSRYGRNLKPTQRFSP